MNAAKAGLARVSLKACDSLAESIAKINLNEMNLNELKEQPELVESMKKRLTEENSQLKQEIEQVRSKITAIQEKLPKNVYTEQYPLKAPEVLSTTRLHGDALLKNHGGDEASKTEKSEKDADVATPAAGKDPANRPPKAAKEPKEPKNKEAKAKGGKQQTAAKEPENEKIDSSRLNLLIGKVVEVNRHPDAEKLYVEKIDVGEEQPRTVVSGLVDYIELEKFQNKLVVALCNLKPAKLRGVLSEAMVMCASDKENNKVELLEPPAGSVPGDRVVFEQYPGEPDSQLNPKKKIWEAVAVDLKTDANKVACYKGDAFRVKDKGVVTAPTLANTVIR